MIRLPISNVSVPLKLTRCVLIVRVSAHLFWWVLLRSGICQRSCVMSILMRFYLRFVRSDSLHVANRTDVSYRLLRVRATC